MAQIARIRPSHAARKCPYPFWCGILAGVMASLPSFLPESRSQPFIFKLVHALTPSCVLGSPRDRHQSTRLALYFRFRPSPPGAPHAHSTRRPPQARDPHLIVARRSAGRAVKTSRGRVHPKSHRKPKNPLCKREETKCYKFASRASSSAAWPPALARLRARRVVSP